MRASCSALFATVSVALSIPAPGVAQPGRPLTTVDYDQWKTISSPTLTNDGRWAVYTLVPEVGEGWLVARSTAGATEYKFSRGFVGRHRLQTSGSERFPAT